MRFGSESAKRCLAGGLVALACLVVPGGAEARIPARLHPARPATRGELARVARYWTPARMRSAAPLDAPHRPMETALASFARVSEPTVAPYAVNGRLFIKQGAKRGYCSATAINSPTRRLVLTAGHCINTGPRGRRRTTAWSRYLEFVPAYSNGVAPFGAFIARRNEVFAPRQWVMWGNPNFDVGAMLTAPNAEGVNVADAVGGGATIAVDRSRHEEFETFGYPGKRTWMQGCDSPYIGDDSRTYGAPGPPTMAIRCRWTPGASGGGWLIDEGTAIDGLTSYGKLRDFRHTFGPYFSRRNVGHLVAGM